MIVELFPPDFLKLAEIGFPVSAAERPREILAECGRVEAARPCYPHDPQTPDGPHDRPSLHDRTSRCIRHNPCNPCNRHNRQSRTTLEEPLGVQGLTVGLLALTGKVESLGRTIKVERPTRSAEPLWSKYGCNFQGWDTTSRIETDGLGGRRQLLVAEGIEDGLDHRDARLRHHFSAGKLSTLTGCFTLRCHNALHADLLLVLRGRRHLTRLSRATVRVLLNGAFILVVLGYGPKVSHSATDNVVWHIGGIR